MGGVFGVVSSENCVTDLFFGVDYHSHLGTRRGGMAVFSRETGFERAIHNIENSPFRTKFERDVGEMAGHMGIGCISDSDPQPLIVRSHLGNYAITTVGRINNLEELVKQAFENGSSHFLEMSGGRVNATELTACPDQPEGFHPRRYSSCPGTDRRVDDDSSPDKTRAVRCPGPDGAHAAVYWEKRGRLLCFL